MRPDRRPPTGQARVVRNRPLVRAVICVGAAVALGLTLFAMTTTSAVATTSFDDSLSAVSCVGTYCEGVGSYTRANVSYTLAERWNGSTWAFESTPLPAGGSLVAVSCIATAACWAVGSNATDGMVVERLQGTTWTIVAARQVVGLGDVLDGISCSSHPTISCAAVGSVQYTDFEWGDLVGVWHGHGSWSFAGPVFGAGGGAGPTALTGVSCSRATFCMAVGEYQLLPLGVGGGGPIAETWNGAVWTPVSTTNVTTNGLSCVSPTDCVSIADPWRWDGHLWSFMPGGSWTTQASVSCTSASNCMAVAPPVRWNGSKWTPTVDFALPGPIQTTNGPAISAVSCSNGSYCMAVGSYSVNPSGGPFTVAELWQGSSWHALKPPNR